MGEVFAIRQLRISSRATIATAALLAPILLFMGTCFILPLVELLSALLHRWPWTAVGVP